MNPSSSHIQGEGSTPGEQLIAVSQVSGWTVHEYDGVASTNLVAARLPTWHAVRANTQTAGRGRFQRQWVSDAGGLWLSAVVPVGAGPEWGALPLLVGLAASDALAKIGLNGFRMRWPNDLLIHNRKLAGLLVDQFRPGQAVAGIGINVTNTPEKHAPELAAQTASLSELMNPVPSPSALGGMVLQALRCVMDDALANGPRQQLARVNQLWGGVRPVELDLDGPTVAGLFVGVDPDGRLLLETQGRGHQAFSPHQVRHLREL